ncbi:MAG: ankyrin repeat domain-containing protein [Betaproteobacteria bacterium]|nr:ankyrin repeat domain-containing protein [Betaproteobacteria bacterium]
MKLYMRYVLQTVVMASVLLVLPAHADVYQRFFTAVGLDDGKTVAALLSRGFDPNTPNERGEPPLVTALRDGRLEVAEALLRHPDLKVDQPNLSNETALMMASLRGLAVWAQRLIDRGAAVNRTGWSPILYLASGGDVATLQVLLKAGADLQAVNPSGSTPLIMAARFGRDDVVMALVAAGADPLHRNPAGQDAVAAARWAGREWLADQLEKMRPGR